MQICCILFTSIGFYVSHTQQHSTNYYGVLNNCMDYSTYTNSLVLFIFLWPKLYGNSNWIFISEFHVRFQWTNCCAVCRCFGFHLMPYLTFSFAFPHTIADNHTHCEFDALCLFECLHEKARWQTESYFIQLTFDVPVCM